MSADPAPLHSCLYHGVVQHRRLAPGPHRFRYRLFLTYLDLEELDRIFARRWLWSTSRPALARFRRQDYLDCSQHPLCESVRELVRDRAGIEASGPIRLLTNLRYFGYLINPISLYYCFDAADRRIEAVVAEVTNTPWGERHCYVLPGPDTPDARVWRTRSSKELHVSPFLPIDMRYHWRLTTPGERLSVHLENHRQGAKRFDATLLLQRRPITTTTLATSLLRHPFMTGKVAAGIYWQALRLWWKGTPFHPHPRTQAASRAVAPSSH